MTNEEAFEITVNELEWKEVQQSMALKDSDIYNEGIQYLKTCAMAIEKQIPKKPLPEDRYYGNGRCPSCHAVFLDRSTKYCGNCGQALDWEEYE